MEDEGEKRKLMVKGERERESVSVCGNEKIERNKERTIFCPRTTLLADVLLLSAFRPLENFVVDSSAEKRLRI